MESPSLDDHQTFHSPNSGITRSSISLPREVLRVVNELDGQTLALRDAMRKIICVANTKKYKVRIYEESIILKEDASQSFHFWCLIKFKPPP